MAMWNQFPYTNFHEQNDDWMLRTIKELQTEVNSITGDKLLDAVKKVLEETGFSVLYNPETETISFNLGGRT